MGALAIAAAAGAALAYFLDPQSGRRRRHVARDRSLALLRGSARKGERLGRLAASEAYGTGRRLTHLRERPKEVPNDQWITDKVETELFRPGDVPKGQINVNTEDGVVVLRGEVPHEDMLRRLEKRARKVQGVREVENLLHLPGSAPEMHQAHGS